MLEVKAIEWSEFHVPIKCVCNHCGVNYDVTEALIYKKGNTYFCSKECCLAYEEERKCHS